MIKHNRILILFSFICCMSVLVACDPSSKDKMTFYENTHTTNLLDENLESIKIGSPSKSVKEAFGEPNFIENIDKPKSQYFIYGKDKDHYDLDFRILKEKVKRYYITNNQHQTAKGISIGSSKDEVIQAYGKDYYERTDTGSKIIGYFDKNEKINIEFGLKKDVVDGIIVSALEN